MEITKVLETPQGKFELSTVFTGDVEKPRWGKKPVFKYEIQVKNLESNKSIEFDFYAPIYDTENGTIIDEDGLLSAFNCFLNDCIVSIENDDVWDFMDYFGYEDGREAQKIFDACKESAAKGVSIGIEEDNIYDLCNYLQDNFEL